MAPLIGLYFEIVCFIELVKRFLYFNIGKLQGQLVQINWHNLTAKITVFPNCLKFLFPKSAAKA